MNMKRGRIFLTVFVLSLGCSVFVAPRLSSGGDTGRSERVALPADVLGVARWLDAAAIKTPAGLTWPADPRDPKSVGLSLYTGAPGVVLFYLEAEAVARTAGETGLADAFLAKACAGADDLLAHIRDKEMGIGLYEGTAGIAFVLEEAYKATRDEKYRAGFLACLETIAQKAVKKGRGVEWSSTTDVISGTAGTGLTLLYAFRETGDKRWLELAAAAGERLVELGAPKNDGLDWAMDPSYPRLMPNFSHGTAGVAFFLARLSEETKRKEFLDTALAGGRYLVSIAKIADDSCLIFHDEPDGKDLYYLGWCHGPVGTANLFYELYRLTGDGSWMRLVEKQAHGLMDSGIPDKETPGFWNNDGICCGLAGVSDFFLSLFKITRNEHHLVFGRRALSVLERKATRDENGTRWVQAEHRTRPDFVVAQTGLMQGAAGIGLIMLRWAEFDAGSRFHPRITMPDTVF
jgi:lantibiotic modifying enzyme